MAILGTLVDVTSGVSRAGDDGSHVVTTLAHSLPATNPEIQIPILRSIEAGSGCGVDVCQLMALGGNASIQTVGYAKTESTASAPVVFFDVVAMVLHSAIR